MFPLAWALSVCFGVLHAGELHLTPFNPLRMQRDESQIEWVKEQCEAQQESEGIILKLSGILKPTDASLLLNGTSVELQPSGPHGTPFEIRLPVASPRTVLRASIIDARGTKSELEFEAIATVIPEESVDYGPPEGTYTVGKLLIGLGTGGLGELVSPQSSLLYLPILTSLDALLTFEKKLPTQKLAWRLDSRLKADYVLPLGQPEGPFYFPTGEIQWAWIPRPGIARPRFYPLLGLSLRPFATAALLSGFTAGVPGGLLLPRYGLATWFGVGVSLPGISVLGFRGRPALELSKAAFARSYSSNGLDFNHTSFYQSWRARFSFIGTKPTPSRWLIGIDAVLAWLGGEAHLVDLTAQVEVGYRFFP